MQADLLIVSVDDFPIQINRTFEEFGFNCTFARGGIKTKEILKSRSVDAIVWLYWGHEKELAKDLLKIFNRYSKIPIVFITQSYDELDFAEEIKGLFANVDLNDDIEDILGTIESACNRQIDSEIKIPADNPPEIDFKNAVSLALDEKLVKDGEKKIRQEKTPLKDLTLWNAVDNNEKRLLSKEEKPGKQPMLSRFKSIFK